MGSKSYNRINTTNYGRIYFDETWSLNYSFRYFTSTIKSVYFGSRLNWERLLGSLSAADFVCFLTAMS